MDHFWAIALTIYALVLWVVLFFVWHKAYKEWKENRANRLRKFHARVLDRRIVTAASASASEYLALFEFAGQQQEFEVGESLYNDLRVGQEGTLYTRGGKYEMFEPQPREKADDDIYRRMVRG